MGKPTVVSIENLRHQAIENLRSFHQFMRLLNVDQPETINFGQLYSTWRSYYFGQFAHFDSLLRAYAEEDGKGYQCLLPLSISHHNLQRLMEVLYSEIGDQPLGATHVPERILDLREVCSRLLALLEREGQAGATQTK